MVVESPRGDRKKGDLAITVIAARNLRSDGKVENAYCVVELSDNKPVRTQILKDKKEPVWNETFNLDLFSLDAAEVLVSVYAKRRITADKFLGQIQVPIKALSVPKEEQWYFLTDKPNTGAPETPKSKKQGSVRGRKTVTKSDDESQPTFISGELCVRLQFIHRLMRGKSRGHLLSSLDPPDSPRSVNSSHSSPTSPTASAPTSSPLPIRTVSFLDTRKPELTLGGISTNAMDDPTLSNDEAIIIDNALREKQRLVMQRLEEKRELVRVLKDKVAMLQSQPDHTQYEAEQKRLQEMQNELRELETLEQEVLGLLDSQKIRKEVQNKERDLRRGSFIKPSGQNGNQSKRQSVKIDPSKRLTSRMASIPRLDMGSIAEMEKYDTDDPVILHMRIKMLESQLENEKRLCDMANSKILLLEKENKRLESEVGVRSRSLSNADRTHGADMFHPQQTMELYTVVKIQNEINLVTKDSKEALEERRKDAEEKLKEVELDIEENIIKQKRLEVELLERRVHHRQGVLSKVQSKSRKAQFKVDEDDDGELSSASDDSGDFDADVSELSNRSRSKSPKLIPEPSTDRFEMLVGKLEKLDKLDEVLRKIDAMKYISLGDNSGGGATSSSGRSYSDLKLELDELQKIICDDTNKHTEKEKEDANIKYEKTFGELSQTSEFKMEQAQALEEKRKLNEPLNKDALDRMLKVYTPDSIRNDPIVKDKVNKNPELVLIGMDPKAILAKHQNDFSQYLLRLTDIDDLRAIRASLPKFRNDQKRQLEWVEILESKIDQVTKAPPKKPAAPPKPMAPKWKAKAPPKGVKPTDMFAELLAKRKGADPGGAEAEEKKPEPEKPKEATISKIKLAPMKTSGALPALTSPLVNSPPPPPPPPSLQF